MSDQSSPVQLYIYDLSQGIARLMSMQLTGRQIDAIYHTSVVVYGWEYFFGAGIMSTPPGQSHHGVPIETLQMGTTHIPREVFLEYLGSMRQTWTHDKYHLLDNNCNNFSNELCQFLVGKTIPDRIVGLPAEFLQTPLGQSLRPMIEGMFGPSRATGIDGLGNGTPVAPAPTAVKSAAPPAGGNYGSIQRVQDLPQFQSVVRSSRLVVAFFTRDGCAPCKMIAPEFENIVSTANSTYTQIGAPKLSSSPRQFVNPVIVHATTAPFLPQHFSISAFPTFLFFLDGTLDQSLTVLGADRARLRNTVESLVGKQFPPHPHAGVKVNVGGRPSVFGVGQDLAKVVAKLKELSGEGVDKKTWDVVEEVAGRLGKDKLPSQSAGVSSTRIVAAFRTLYRHLVARDVDSIFPLVDILRLCVLDEPLRNTFLDKDCDAGKLVMEIVGRCVKPEGKEVGKAGRVMVLRMVSNLFSHPSSALLALSTTSAISDSTSPTPITYRALTTSLLVESLLSPETVVRTTASSLAYSVSLAVASSYNGAGVDILSGGSVWTHAASGVLSDDDDAWLVEVVSAVARAAEEEKDGEAVVRLVAAVTGLVRFGDETVTGLCKAVEVLERAKEKIKAELDQGKEAKKLGKRVVEAVDGLERLLAI